MTEPQWDKLGKIVNHLRGHLVHWDEHQVLRYSDNGEIVPRQNERPCIKCGKPPSPDGHDACIANLPGVKFACCGHGVMCGYAAFENGQVIRGWFDERKS